MNDPTTDEPLGRIKVQLTFDPKVHDRLIRVLAPLNRYQRKALLTLLIYQGLSLEQRAPESPQLSPAPPPNAAAADDTGAEWIPQIDGDAAQALGLPL